MEMAAFVLPWGIRYGHCGANDMHVMTVKLRGKEAEKLLEALAACWAVHKKSQTLRLSLTALKYTG